MLDVSADTIRQFLHVFSVSVWVGGQIIMAALLPVLRGLGPDAPRRAANQFGKVAWPFFALVVATGIWNMFEVDFDGVETSYHVTLGVKMLLVAAAGGAAGVHSLTDSPALRGITGAIGLIGSLAALFFGVVLVT